MATMRKFLFETDFDPPKKKKQAEPEPEPVIEEPPPPPPPPTVLESEALRMEAEALARGLAEGEAKGRAEGEAKGKAEATKAFEASLERATAECLAGIADQLSTLVTTHREAMRVSQTEALAVARAATAAVFPEYEKRHGADEVAAIVGDVLDRLREEPQATVRVSETAAEALQIALEPVLDRLGFKGELILQVDPQFSAADVEVSWRGGGAQRTSAELRMAVDQAIAAVLPTDAPSIGVGEASPAEEADDAPAADGEPEAES